MKKLSTVVATLAFGLTLYACEQNTYEQAPASSPAPAAEPAEADEPAVQIELKGSDGSVKINSD